MSRVPPTADQIRHRIDSGESGDKVAFPDPSAAPLGTDDEASGHPLTPRQRRLEDRQQRASAPSHTRREPSVLWLLAGAVALIFAVVTIILLADG